MAKLLNFGSINLDHVYGVAHFVAGGETLSALSLEHYFGGKGMNQSIALARAGAEVYHAGRVGPDGISLVEELKNAGVDTRYISTDGSVTGHTIIQVDAFGQNCILVYAGANGEIGEPFIKQVLAHFEAGDVLLLQNEVSNLACIANTAAAKGVRIALNPSPFNEKISEDILQKVSWLLLNEIEGRAITGEEDPQAIGASLREKYPRMTVVLTIGKQGVLYWDETQALGHGIYRVPVVDTTAAGDTFTGYFLASVMVGRPAAEALRLASVASSIAVSRPGAAASVPLLEEVLGSDLQLP